MIRLGQLLHQKRLQKKLTLEEVSKKTKIKEAFLAAIERGEYDKLPSPAYAKGFVANYVSFLDLPKTEMLALFRREFDEKKAYKVLPDSLTKQETFPLRRFKLLQPLVLTGIVLLFFVIYLLFQYRAAFFAPVLTIIEPKQGTVVTKEVFVKGKTDRDATVVVNEKPVSLKKDGSFTKTLILFEGPQTITITSANRFGKETTIQREVVVK